MLVGLDFAALNDFDLDSVGLAFHCTVVAERLVVELIDTQSELEAAKPLLIFLTEIFGVHQVAESGREECSGGS